MMGGHLRRKLISSIQCNNSTERMFGSSGKNTIENNSVNQVVENVNMFPILPSIGVHIKF